MRNILAKIPWMGIAALLMTLIMVLDPVLALAEESGSGEEIVIFSSDGNETVVGGNSSDSDESDDTYFGGSIQGKTAAIIDDDEIWALVDKEELRSLVDVDELRSSIDVPSLIDSNDKDELRAGIDGMELLSKISEEELKEEFAERKLDEEYFVIDEETGEGRSVTKEEYIELKGDVTEDAADDADSSFAEKIDEETVVLEDGREVTTFKVKLPEGVADSHPIDVTNVQLPVMGATSPFDFIIDPMELIYQTDAAKYGGGRVEEGASVLFRNSKGEYDFSHKSDMLEVINKSNVPVRITISASIQNPDSVPLVTSFSELSGDKPSLFMALVDDYGIVSAITSYDEASFEVSLNAAPDGTYVYAYNEATGSYDYAFAEGAENAEFDAVSFGIIASCNTEADWTQVESWPVINVNWKVTPMLTDWDEVIGEDSYEAAMKLTETEEFDAFKLVKAAELAEERLIELILEKVNELKDEALEKLIEEEITKLAYRKYAEVLGEADERDVEEKTSESGESDDKVKIIESSDTEESVNIIESGGEEAPDITESDPPADKTGDPGSEEEDIKVEETKDPQAESETEFKESDTSEGSDTHKSGEAVEFFEAAGE